MASGPVHYRSRKQLDALAVIASVLAAIIYAPIEYIRKPLVGLFKVEFHLGATFVFAVVVAALVFFTFQFVRFWIQAGSLRRTLRHYFGLIREFPPLAWIAVVSMLILLLSLVALSVYLAIPPKDALPAIGLVFCCTATAMGLFAWMGGLYYRDWIIRRAKTPIQALANESRLTTLPDMDDKDDYIRQFLSSIRGADFVFLWGIHFSRVVGREDGNHLNELRALVDKNPQAQFHALLQCPYSEDVIERSIELGYHYDDEYVSTTAESLANCIACDRFSVTLRVHQPFFRTVLWGTLVNGSPFNGYDTAATPLSQSDMLTRDTRFLANVIDGGFVVQEYPRRVEGSRAPLVRGNVRAHGGIWNTLRLIFLREVGAGIDVRRGIATADEDTLRALGSHLHLGRKLRRCQTKNDVIYAIQQDGTFDSFLQRTYDLAKS